MNERIERVNAAATAADPRQSARRLLLSAAMEEVSDYGGNVIPEGAGSWFDQRRDGAGKGQPVGDRALCLSRIARQAQEARSLPSLPPIGDGTELRLAGDLEGGGSHPSAFSGDPAAEVERIFGHLKKMGIVPDDDTPDDPTDTRSPRKGGGGPGRRTRGIARDESEFGAEAQSVIDRNIDLFRGRPSHGRFGQRDSGSHFSGNGPGRGGY